MVIITRLTFAGWPQMFGKAKMTEAMLYRLSRHCDIVETGDEN